MKKKELNKEKPKIFAVKKNEDKDGVTRRKFIGLGLGTGVLLTGVSDKVFAKKQKKQKIKINQNKEKLPGDLCDNDKVKAHAYLSAAKSIAISSDNRLLVSGSSETIKLWSLPEGKLLKTLKTNARCVAISPDNKLLISGSYKTIKLWSLPDGKLLKTLEAHSSAVNTIDLSSDNKLLISGSYDETIKIWNLPDGKLLKTLKGNSGEVSSIAICPNNRLLISGSYKTIKLWSLPDGKLLKTLEEDSGRVYSIAISSDNRLLVSGNFKTIRLWSLPDGNLIKTLYGHSSFVNTIAISPDNKLLVSGSNDKVIKIWSLLDEKLSKINEKSMPVKNTIASAAGTALIIQKVKTDEGEKTNQIHLNNGQKIAAGIMAGSLIHACTSKKINNKSNVNSDIPDYSGKLLETLSGHSHFVNSIAISPDNKLLISASNDETIKIWSLPEGKLLGCLYDPELTNAINCKEVRHTELKTMTLPCGSPLPAGATCICDCVESSRSYPGTETVCVCNTIMVSTKTRLSGNATCVCNTVSVGTKDINDYNVKRKHQMNGSVCTCNTICTCNTVSTSSGSSSYSYWYPN